jgi:hypothetical protein
MVILPNLKIGLMMYHFVLDGVILQTKHPQIDFSLKSFKG